MLPGKLKPPLPRGNEIRKKSGKDLTTKRPTPSNQQYTAVEFCYNDNSCIKGLCNNYQEVGAEKLEGGGAFHKIAAKIGGGSK